MMARNTNREDVPDGAFHVRMTRNVEGMTFGFEWHGGAYIEICRGEAFAHPSEVINVWDYAADAPRIARTRDAMATCIDEWIADYDSEALVHDATRNW